MTSLDTTAIDPIALLVEDHKQLVSLFTAFAQATSDDARLRIIDQASAALAVHSAIEEQVFYPAARNLVADPQSVDKAIAEHAAAQNVMEELAESHDSAKRVQQFGILVPLIQEHINTEEREIFPQCRGWPTRFDELGMELQEAKRELSRVRQFL